MATHRFCRRWRVATSESTHLGSSGKTLRSVSELSATNQINLSCRIFAAEQSHSLTWLAFLPVVATILVVGCGSGEPEKFEVRGRVVFNSTPLPYGSVTFFGPRGKLYGTADIDTDGNYQLYVPAGAYTVGVYAHPGFEKPTGSALTEGPIASGGKPLAGPIVPEKYNHFTSSPFHVEISASGENTFDIDIP